MTFSAEFRRQVSDGYEAHLDKFEKMTGTFASVAGRCIVWTPSDNPKELFDNLVDLVYATYGSKFVLLNRSLMTAVNSGDFLTYGLIGRCIIEHGAQLRYYVTEKMLPIIERAS